MPFAAPTIFSDWQALYTVGVAAVAVTFAVRVEMVGKVKVVVVVIVFVVVSVELTGSAETVRVVSSKAVTYSTRVRSVMKCDALINRLRKGYNRNRKEH